jgi:cysteinyl-tRNA synthetase
VLDDNDHAKLVKFGFVQLDDGFLIPPPMAEQRFSVPQPYSFDDGGFPASAAPLAKSLSDEQIEKLIAERAAARRGGDYARSDEIRANLLKAGVILEDTKAGARWKRK